MPTQDLLDLVSFHWDSYAKCLAELTLTLRKVTELLSQAVDLTIPFRAALLFYQSAVLEMKTLHDSTHTATGTYSFQKTSHPHIKRTEMKIFMFDEVNRWYER